MVRGRSGETECGRRLSAPSNKISWREQGEELWSRLREACQE